MKFYSRVVIILFAVLFVQKSFAGWENYENAVRNFQHARFDSTIYYARQVPKTDSLYFYAQLLTGHAYLEMDSLNKADDAFQNILNAGDKRFYVYNGIGLVHLYKYEKSRGVIKVVKRIFSNDDLQKAMELFQRALKQNPDYLDATINYDRALLVSGNRADLVKARNSLDYLVLKYPDNTDIRYYLGVCKYKMSDIFGAIESFIKVLNLDPFNSKANFSVAFAYFDEKEYKLFSKYYLKGCAGLHDPVQIRKLINDIQDIMSDREKQTIAEGLPDGQFLLTFWQQRDPIPMTEENERLIEHYKRLQYARDNYAGGTDTGYDDRGKIYVRYGPPDDFYRSVSSDGLILDNESWVYQINAKMINFDFVLKGGGFVLVKDLSDALVNSDYQKELPTLIDMYTKRAHLSNYYMNVYQSLFNMEPRGVTGVLNDVKATLNRYTAPEQSKIAQLPISTYDVALEGSDLQFDFDKFKYFDFHKNSWNVDILYGLNLNQVDFVMSGNQFKGSLDQSLIVDPSNVAINKETKNNTLTFVSKDNVGNQYYVNKVKSRVYAGNNKVYFKLRNESSNKFRIVETSVHVPEQKKEIVMSDLLLSDNVHASTAGDDSLFCRNGFFIHPVPARNFDRNRVLYSYFELYNGNSGPDNSGRCQVEYRIKEYSTGKNLTSLLNVVNPFKSKKPSNTSVAIVNELEFSGSHEPVLLSFDISTLQSGTYEFEVEVTDLRNQATAKAGKLFQVN